MEPGSGDPVCAALLREAGGPERLVELLGSLDSQEQANALGAFALLAARGEFSDDVRQHGPIPQVVALLDHEEPVVKEKAAEVIWHLVSASNANCLEDTATVLECHAAGSLFAGLLPTSPDGTGMEDYGVATAAIASAACATLGAIATLSACPEGRQALNAEAGGSDLLALLLASEGGPPARGSTSELVQERAATCVENLALDRQGRQALLQSGCVAELVKMLSSESPGAVRAAIGALRNFSADEEGKAKMSSARAVPRVLELLKSEEPDVAQKSAECIGNFALESSGRSEVKALGGFPLLVGVLKTGTANVQLAAAGALLNIAVEVDFNGPLRNAGAAYGLLPLLQSSPTALTRNVAAMALRNLAADPEGAVSIVEAGGLRDLVACLEAAAPSDGALRESVALCFWNLAAGPASQLLPSRTSIASVARPAVACLKSTIAESGAIPALLGSLASSTAAGCEAALEASLGALQALSESPEGRLALASATDLAPLFEQLASARDPVAAKAAGTTWHLAYDQDGRGAILRHGGVKFVVALLARPSQQLRSNALGALLLLLEQADCIEEAYLNGAVVPIVDLLSTESDLSFLQSAAHALGSIAEGNEERQTAIGNAEGLSTLSRLISQWAPTRNIEQQGPSAEQDLLAKCCYAVWLLCEKHPGNQARYYEAGGVAEFATLLNPANEETLLEMATGAAAAICDKKGRVLVDFRDGRGIEYLVQLLDHDCASVRTNAANVLYRLCDDLDNRHEVHVLGGIEKLSELLNA